MCIHFMDLNASCQNDCYSLSSIDNLISQSSGCELLSFMDAYFGYNHIHMRKEEKEKSAFIAEQGAFCFLMIPFGLKNVRATLQRLMDFKKKALWSRATRYATKCYITIDNLTKKCTSTIDHRAEHAAKARSITIVGIWICIYQVDKEWIIGRILISQKLRILPFWLS